MKDQIIQNAKKCFNQDVGRAKYLEILIDSTNGHAAEPYKLLLTLQQSKGKETCNELAKGKTNPSSATIQPKTLGFNGDAMILIVDSATIENAVKISPQKCST